MIIHTDDEFVEQIKSEVDHFDYREDRVARYRKETPQVCISTKAGVEWQEVAEWYNKWDRWGMGARKR